MELSRIEMDDDEAVRMIHFDRLDRDISDPEELQLAECLRFFEVHALEKGQVITYQAWDSVSDAEKVMCAVRDVIAKERRSELQGKEYQVYVEATTPGGKVWEKHGEPVTRKEAERIAGVLKYDVGYRRTTIKRLGDPF